MRGYSDQRTVASKIIEPHASQRNSLTFGPVPEFAAERTWYEFVSSATSSSIQKDEGNLGIVILYRPKILPRANLEPRNHEKTRRQSISDIPTAPASVTSRIAVAKMAAIVGNWSTISQGGRRYRRLMQANFNCRIMPPGHEKCLHSTSISTEDADFHAPLIRDAARPWGQHASLGAPESNTPQAR
jgi:hypothetical protein